MNDEIITLGKSDLENNNEKILD